METTQKKPGTTAKMLGILGIGLCALCCTLPIIGILTGAGVLGAIALYAEKVAVILLIASAAAFGIWFYRKRQVPACPVDCPCKEQSTHEVETNAR